MRLCTVEGEKRRALSLVYLCDHTGEEHTRGGDEREGQEEGERGEEAGEGGRGRGNGGWGEVGAPSSIKFLPMNLFNFLSTIPSRDHTLNLSSNLFLI